MAVAGVAAREGRLGAMVGALRDTWHVAWSGGRPIAARAQAMAFVLLLVLAVGSVGAADDGWGDQRPVLDDEHARPCSGAIAPGRREPRRRRRPRRPTVALDAEHVARADEDGQADPDAEPTTDWTRPYRDARADRDRRPRAAGGERQ